jgi:hypothetical protein
MLLLIKWHLTLVPRNWSLYSLYETINLFKCLVVYYKAFVILSEMITLIKLSLSSWVTIPGCLQNAFFMKSYISALCVTFCFIT